MSSVCLSSSNDNKDWWHQTTTDGSSFTKRVSLDATETFLSSSDINDDEPWSGGAFLSAEDVTMQDAEFPPPLDELLGPMSPPLVKEHDEDVAPLDTILLLHDTTAAATATTATTTDDDDMWMSLLDDDDDGNDHNNETTTTSVQDLWKERRTQLAASMHKSQQSRTALSQHIQQRATLQQVLQEIEKSSAQVSHLILKSSSAAAAESSTAAATDTTTTTTTTTV